MTAIRELAPSLTTQVAALRAELERYAEVTERGERACRAGNVDDLDAALAERDRLSRGIDVLTQVLSPAHLPPHLRAATRDALASLSDVIARVERATADLGETIRARRDLLEREIQRASHEIDAVAAYSIPTAERPKLNLVR